ncbi:hypothetical protein FH063_006713 [Azospirillum argentinense]|uniref:Uncharacterized protein n=1 Tax=Azospirillum argentinense TaxID=2970906 RepID=A0A5B0KP58_9PROT|nr:hypothetical protein FH063_006713 [Azospirillum argentinense]
MVYFKPTVAECSAVSWALRLWLTIHGQAFGQAFGPCRDA